MSYLLFYVKAQKTLKIDAIPINEHEILTFLQDSYSFCIYVNKCELRMQICDI